MKAAVLVFPGINRERDMARTLKLVSGQEPTMVWHADTSLPVGTDLVVIPGGFSYGDYLRVPVAHGEGNYVADDETIKRLEGEGRVLYRYVSPKGELDPAWNVNGAINAIAGILSDKGNVLGMMPHPENHVEASMGVTDGRGLFAGLADHLKRAA